MFIGVKTDYFILNSLRTQVNIWQILICNELHVVDFVAQFEPHRKVNRIVTSEYTEMGVILVPDLDGYEMLEAYSVSYMWLLFFI